ncbi:hypothetical protein [Paenibacillus sp. CMAA1364]
MDTGETQASDVPLKLGIKLNEMCGYQVSGNGETNIKELYIIGDTTNVFQD